MTSRREILEKIVKQGDCAGVRCSANKGIACPLLNNNSCEYGIMDSAKGAKAALEKLKKEQAVSEFKTQQEIWKWLVEGGKVQNKELGEEVLHFKDGHLVQLKTGIGVSCSLLHHSHWRKYTEPFKSSTEIYARKGRHIQDNPAFLMDRLNLSDWSRSKKGDDYIKVRITVEQIEE